MTPIVFLDTETTSLRPDRRVWDIGMIRRDDEGEREISIYVADVDLSGADLTSLRIGHFFERHPRYRRPLYDVDDHEWDAPRTVGQGEHLLNEWAAARVVEQWTRGAHIVGAVPNFDTEVLGDMLRRHERCPAWHYHLIDVENLAVGWLHGVAARAVDEAVERGESPDPALVQRHMPLPWKSDDISRACGVEPASDEERHTALGDARWAMRLYDKTVGSSTDVDRDGRS